MLPEDPSVLSIKHSEHISKLYQENYAYIVDLMSAIEAQEKDKDLMIMDEMFPVFNYAFAFPEGSSYTAHINQK